MTLSVSVEQQARSLAADNREAEPAIKKVYWFPDAEEVRLLSLSPNLPINADGEVHPFYFRPSPSDGLPLPSAIALIRPEEFGKLKLPERWGGWSDAIEI